MLIEPHECDAGEQHGDAEIECGTRCAYLDSKNAARIGAPTMKT